MYKHLASTNSYSKSTLKTPSEARDDERIYAKVAEICACAYTIRRDVKRLSQEMKDEVFDCAPGRIVAV
jgi:hypothetical protein